MDSGEVRRYDPSRPTSRPEESKIIEYPENYEDMIDKLQKQERRNIERVLASTGAESLEDVKKTAALAINKRMTRAASEHKPLKDHTVIKESKSPDVLSLKKQLYEEMNAIFQQAIKSLPPGDLSTLKNKVIGRFKDLTHTPPGEKGPQITPSSGPKKE